MSTISWPTGLQAIGFRLVLVTVDRSFASPFGGSEQVVDLLNDRWMASLELPPALRSSGGQVEGFIAALRGMTNTVALWHMARPYPLGTMRGTPTINGAHAQGVATLAITTTAGATLKQGDMIGAGGMLFMVASDCTASGAGALSVPIANRLRTALSGGAAVTWAKPTTLFRKTNRVGVDYADIANSVTLDFVEAIT